MSLARVHAMGLKGVEGLRDLSCECASARSVGHRIGASIDGTQPDFRAQISAASIAAGTVERPDLAVRIAQYEAGTGCGAPYYVRREGAHPAQPSRLRIKLEHDPEVTGDEGPGAQGQCARRGVRRGRIDTDLGAGVGLAR